MIQSFTNNVHESLSVVKLRSSTPWGKDANLSSFIIPPKKIKRALRKDSSKSTTITLTSHLSVVGFLVYNASSYLEYKKNLLRVGVDIQGKPIKIEIHGSSSQAYQGRKVLNLEHMGKVLLIDMHLPNMCHNRSQGHFSIVTTPFIKKVKDATFLDSWVCEGIFGVCFYWDLLGL
ncbi:hypothetical protein STAS_02497 [Striga asiatica]|uniref:Uncharacterized protein n=1 Tax=Striga asiatica TaxID=4170 RepID=A0A5A7P221_STRAF|nr:hypothetical protein STAS_02497 [Striga asiatica]